MGNTCCNTTDRVLSEIENQTQQKDIVIPVDNTSPSKGHPSLPTSAQGTLVNLPDLEMIYSSLKEETGYNEANITDSYQTSKHSPVAGVYKLRNEPLNADIWYKGTFLDGVPDGYGVAVWVMDGKRVCYAGGFKNGNFEGNYTAFLAPYEYWFIGKSNLVKEEHNGTMYDFANDLKYNGPLVNQKRNGKGTLEYADKSVYTGDFKDDKRTGKGKIIFQDGSWYEGDWINDNMTGKGTYVWDDKRKYVGEWRDSHMHGEGVYTWPDGKKFVGKYVYGNKEGYGEFHWTNGMVYKGGWKNGKQEGQGELMDTTGDVLRAVWEAGKRITG